MGGIEKGKDFSILNPLGILSLSPRGIRKHSIFFSPFTCCAVYVSLLTQKTAFGFCPGPVFATADYSCTPEETRAVWCWTNRPERTSDALARIWPGGTHMGLVSHNTLHVSVNHTLVYVYIQDIYTIYIYIVYCLEIWYLEVSYLTLISHSLVPSLSVSFLHLCCSILFAIFFLHYCVSERETDREKDRERTDTWAQFLNNVIRCKRY